MNTERPHNYILIGQTPVPEPDLMTWAWWMEENREACRVAKADVPDGYVSTIFLGLDHRHLGDGPPLLFETAYFKAGDVEDIYRCGTWAEAEAQHAGVVASLQPGNTKAP